jgi:hypothetical protein
MILPRLQRVALSAVLVTCAAAHAQIPCVGRWTPGLGLAGVDRPAYVLTQWDPDGPGPQSPTVVTSGEFTLAGTSFTSGPVVVDLTQMQLAPMDDFAVDGIGKSVLMPNGDVVFTADFAPGNPTKHRIARWDGSTVQTLGQVWDRGPDDLALSPSGELFAANLYEVGGGHIPLARWNGSVWQPVPGAPLYARHLVMLPNGDLIASSSYSIAKWDGVTWTPLGTGQGFDGSGVYGLARAGNGDIIAVGHFQAADGVPARGVARWDGSAWGPISLGSLGHYADDAVTAPNGDVIAAFVADSTSFEGTSVSSNIRRWNGVSWLSVGPTLNGRVTCIHALPDGAVLAVGDFVSPSAPFVRNIALSRSGQWTAWSEFGSGLPYPVRAQATLPTGALLVAASEPNTGWVARPGRLFQHNIEGWSRFAPDFSRQVYAVAVTPTGRVFAGGAFAYVGPTFALKIARWDGVEWGPLARGVNGDVNVILPLSGEEVVVGGAFTTADLGPANRIARWDGAAWHALGAGFNAEVRALARMPDGNIVAGGAFQASGVVPVGRVAVWDGTEWSALGQGFNGAVNALAVLPGGGLVAGGQFTESGAEYSSAIARWQGGAWIPVDDPHARRFDFVRALGVLPDGRLVVGGKPTTADGSAVALWDGSDWTPLTNGPNGDVYSIHVLPGGDISVGGTFTAVGTGPSAHIARFEVPTADFDRDGSPATDADIEAFFACLAGSCCPTCGTADFNFDGDTGTDADIEAFFRVLAGGSC